MVDRKPLISGNWKMHHNHFEAIQTVQKLSYALTKEDHALVDVSIHPPFTDLRSVQTVLDADSIPIALGAKCRAVVAPRSGGGGSGGFVTRGRFPAHGRAFGRLGRENLQFGLTRFLVREHRFGGVFRNLGLAGFRGAHGRLGGAFGGVDRSGRFRYRRAGDRSRGRSGRSGLRGRLVDGRRARHGGFAGERVFVFARWRDDRERGRSHGWSRTLLGPLTGWRPQAPHSWTPLAPGRWRASRRTPDSARLTYRYLTCFVFFVKRRSLQLT